MHWVDWVIVAAFLGLNIAIGIYFSRGGGVIAFTADSIQELHEEEEDG